MGREAFEMIILFKGKVGPIYNIGGSNERTNIDVARDLIKLSGHAKPDDMITFVEDRVFNDLRCTVPTGLSPLPFRPSFHPILPTAFLLCPSFLHSIFCSIAYLFSCFIKSCSVSYLHCTVVNTALISLVILTDLNRYVLHYL